MDGEESGKEQAVEKDAYNQQLAQDVAEEQESRKEETEKKKTDDLWASFIADVGAPKQKPKPAARTSGLGSLTSVIKVHVRQLP